MIKRRRLLCAAFDLPGVCRALLYQSAAAVCHQIWVYWRAGYSGLDGCLGHRPRHSGRYPAVEGAWDHVVGAQLGRADQVGNGQGSSPAWWCPRRRGR